MGHPPGYRLTRALATVWCWCCDTDHVAMLASRVVLVQLKGVAVKCVKLYWPRPAGGCVVRYRLAVVAVAAELDTFDKPLFGHRGTRCETSGDMSRMRPSGSSRCTLNILWVDQAQQRLPSLVIRQRPLDHWIHLRRHQCHGQRYHRCLQRRAVAHHWGGILQRRAVAHHWGGVLQRPRDHWSERTAHRQRWGWPTHPHLKTRRPWKAVGRRKCELCFPGLTCVEGGNGG
jgi:hypothetical protein